MIKYDYSALRGKIREKYFTEKNFVVALQNKGVKISHSAFSNKITGKVDFKQSEINEISLLLDIPASYFFKPNYELNS